MFKFVLTIMLAIIPLTATANDLPQITPLEQGQEAPYSGILYNPAAVAETIAQREALIAQHNLNLEILEEGLRAELGLTIANLQADLDGCNQNYNQMIAIKDEQIKNLQELALDSNDSHWWLAGGILSGVLITVGIVYATK
jgi:hypothetical protein